MKPHEKFIGEIRIGQRVHCTLYNGKDGTVVAISGMQSPDSCKILSGFMVAGGRAEFDIIWDKGTESPKIPECLLRGSVQWSIYPEVVGPDQIAAAQSNLLITRAKAKADQEAADTAFATAQYRLLAENAARPKALRLKTREDEACYWKRAICNIRIELKTAFSGVKFSVRRDDGSAYVSWIDGPTQHQVDAVIGKYKGGHFNGMEDIYEHSESPFNTAFGRVKYLTNSREESDSVMQKAIDTLWQVINNVRDLEKPTPATVRYGRIQIPGLNVSVAECVQALASAYNVTEGKFVESTRYGTATFVVEWAVTQQEEGVTA